MKNIYSILFLCLFVVNESFGQGLRTPTLSPFTEIKQEVGLTEIVLSYARPSAKGRAVFGDLVPYGVTWRTGANASTKLIFEEDVKVGGNDLPAGTYALYTIPGPGEWIIIIHKKTDMRSIAGDKVKEENDAFRFKVPSKRISDYVETFTIQMANISTNSCDVVISWENTMVSFPIEVEVNAKIEEQMATLLKEPEKISHRVYFRAAEYYMHNRVDLNKSMEWIDEALKLSENNFRYGLLKSKIYAAKGDKENAIKTVKVANEWATAAENSNYMEQTSLYLKDLMKSKPTKENNAYKSDTESLDQIMKALYSSISGEKGEKRDWDRFRNLFLEDARLIPSGKNNEGITGIRVMSPEDYVQRSGKWLEENGFHEVEIDREVAEYGSLVHVFSSYESYRSKMDKEPFARGINSIQLLNDGERWWILQIYWLGETEDNPIPKEYLPESK